ncbi:MAG: DinB family protein [Bacteroidetes bacterium]|nr:DinB family protein [Bacteroidota bacterium]MBS1929678.1 DinB family protein [Bacteroidota bacterium]
MITLTPWFERKFEFNFPVSMFPVITERLRGTTPRLEFMLQNIPDEKMNHKTGNHWSIKEHIGHLSDLEELWYGRIEDFLTGKEFLRDADLSNSKTNDAGHNSNSMQKLLKEFSRSRNKLIQKAEQMDAATASRTALHPRLLQPMRLIDSLFFVAEHDDHHITVIRGILNMD